MAFGKNKSTIDSPSKPDAPKLELGDRFKCATELETLPRLTVAISGLAKVGKSHFALTVAEATEGPVYVIDTEGAIKINLLHFPNEIREKIFVAEVLQFAGLAKNKVNLVESLEALKESIRLVTEEAIVNNPEITGTFIIDSATDIWDWLQIWLEEAANVKRTKSGDMPRFEWGKANEQYAEIMYMLIRTHWNVIATFRAKEAMSNEGVTLGYNVPRWQKNTMHWFDVIGELQYDDERVLHFTPGRAGRYGDTLPDLKNPTFKGLIEMLEKKTGVKFK